MKCLNKRRLKRQDTKAEEEESGTVRFLTEAEKDREKPSRKAASAAGIGHDTHNKIKYLKQNAPELADDIFVLEKLEQEEKERPQTCQAILWIIDHQLSEHEKEDLEAEIRYWARSYSPIITWRGYIADGHHRYAICQKYGLPFKTEELDVEDEDDVMVWMINNQKESCRNI